MRMKTMPDDKEPCPPGGSGIWLVEGVSIGPGRLGQSKVRGLVFGITPNGGPEMWAQLITTRLKRGREDELPRLAEQLKAVEQPGSGLLRSIAMRDQGDPSRAYIFVLFESEEKARERENDPRRQEGLQTARATMSEIFDGAPEFVDLAVVDEWSP